MNESVEVMSSLNQLDGQGNFGQLYHALRFFAPFLLFNCFEHALRIVGLFEMLFEKITNTASWSASFSLVIFFLFAFACQPRPLHIEAIINDYSSFSDISSNPAIYLLGGGFKYFLFSPLVGDDSHFY